MTVMEKHDPGSRPISLPEGIKEAASSTRTEDEEAGARASITSQGFEERPWQWVWKEEKEGCNGCGMYS